MELAPSLRRAGSDLVNTYLVADDRGVTVIDAGLSGQWPDLLAELAALGRTLDDVRGVVLTHGDTDHLGFAERLRAEVGVPILVHEADAARARGEVRGSGGAWRPMRLGPTMRFLAHAGRRGGLRTRFPAEVTTFTGGDVLDLPGAPRIVHLPGHTPGSVAIHVPAVDAVFVGDALTTGHVLTGRQGPQPAPFTLDPDLAMRSLEELGDLTARWVLPGHGAPWDGGLDEALRQVRQAAPARR